MSRPLIAATLLSLSACVVYDTDTRPGPVNYAPDIVWAEAGCFWDNYAYDWVWYFDADVADPNGRADVWEWLQYQTFLDCGYGGYVVDFVAYDYFDAFDTYAVYPYQSW
jgi:hypothetical protein